MNRAQDLSFLRPFALLAAMALAAFAGLAPATLANDTPGNNGTVKIHDGPGENDPGEVRNEPHVCDFHLHFYFADPEQAGTWEIQEWAPTGVKGTVVLSGTYDTHGDGVDRQPEAGVYSLPDGHYKLFWDGDLDTGKHDKMKVFWVDCAPANASPAPSGNELPAASASTSPIQSAAPSASTTPSQPAAPGGSELPIASGVPGSSTTPTGGELPIASGAPGSSTTPTGGELPIAGSPPPTGEVEGITGTPPAATPPPTDTLAASTPTDDGWRVVVAVVAGLLAGTALLFRGPTAAGTSVDRRRRR